MASNSGDPSTFGVDSTLVQCVFCMDGQGKPLKFLKCNHSACITCLEKKQGVLHGLITCLKCQHETQLPYNLRDLPTNYLQGPVEALTAVTESKACIMCEEYGRKTVSSFVCFDCHGDRMCDDCAKVHQNLRHSRSHKLVSLADIHKHLDSEEIFRKLKPDVRCPRHGQEILRFFCSQCLSIVCCQCIVDSHHGHNCLGLDQVSEEKCRKLEVVMKDLEHVTLSQEAARETQTREIGRHLLSIQMDHDELVNKIKERTEELVTAIRCRGQEQITEANDSYSKQIRYLERRMEAINNAALIAEDTKTLAEMHCQFLPDAMIIQQHQHMATRLDELCRHIEKLKTAPTTAPISLCQPTQEASWQHVTSLFGKLIEGSAVRSAKQEGPLVKAIKEIHLKTRKSVAVNLVTTIESERIIMIRGLDITWNGDIVAVGEHIDSTSTCVEVFTVAGERKARLDLASLKSKRLWDIKCWQEDIFIADCDGRQIIQLSMDGHIRDMIPLEENDRRGQWSIGLALNAAGDIYVSSRDGNALYISQKGGKKAALYRDVSACRHLQEPCNICLTPNDDLVVSSSANNIVSVCTLPDTIKSVYGTHGEAGKKDGQLNGPCGVCCDAVGQIYIADSCNNRVSVLSPHCELITYVLTRRQHQIKNPQCVAVSPDGQFLAVGHRDDRISVYSLAK